MEELDKEYEVIKNRIFALLDEKGISQKEFAKMLGVSSQTVTDWKKGKSRSYSLKLSAIAEALDTTPIWLYFGEGRKFISPEDRKKENEWRLSVLKEASEKQHGEILDNLYKIAPFFALDDDGFRSIAESAGVSLDEVFQRIKKPALPLESELDEELITRLSSLTPEERKQVDAFVQGLLASR